MRRRWPSASRWLGLVLISEK
uniref:Uncharacterized protein n=1 Tax=Arundo donax TaxID=35708 RepID=A0A0A9B6P4_ARUDO